MTPLWTMSNFAAIFSYMWGSGGPRMFSDMSGKLCGRFNPFATVYPRCAPYWTSKNTHFACFGAIPIYPVCCISPRYFICFGAVCSVLANKTSGMQRHAVGCIWASRTFLFRSKSSFLQDFFQKMSVIWSISRQVTHILSVAQDEIILRWRTLRVRTLQGHLVTNASEFLYRGACWRKRLSL